MVNVLNILILKVQCQSGKGLVESGTELQEGGLFCKKLRSALSSWYAEKDPEGIISKPSEDLSDR